MASSHTQIEGIAASPTGQNVSVASARATACCQSLPVCVGSRWRELVSYEKCPVASRTIGPSKSQHASSVAWTKHQSLVRYRSRPNSAQRMSNRRLLTCGDALSHGLRKNWQTSKQRSPASPFGSMASRRLRPAGSCDGACLRGVPSAPRSTPGGQAAGHRRAGRGTLGSRQYPGESA